MRNDYDVTGWVWGLRHSEAEWKWVRDEVERVAWLEGDRAGRLFRARENGEDSVETEPNRIEYGFNDGELDEVPPTAGVIPESVG